MALSLSFPDQNYTESNKPSVGTLKSDLQGIELGVNALEDSLPTLVADTFTSTLDTDGALTANSDEKIPSQKAVKTYVDAVSSDLTDHAADTTTHGTTGAIVGTSDTQTLTNKRVDPRTNTVSSDATPDINVDTTDIFTITAQAAAITSMTSGLTGTPVDGQKLVIRIKDNGTARAITWGASFASRGASLPTTTVLGKYMYVGLIYNSTASVWDCVAVAQEV